MCSSSLPQMQPGSNFSVVCPQRGFAFLKWLAAANPTISINLLLFTVGFLASEEVCYRPDTACIGVTYMGSISFL